MLRSLPLHHCCKPSRSLAFRISRDLAHELDAPLQRWRARAEQAAPDPAAPAAVRAATEQAAVGRMLLAERRAKSMALDVALVSVTRPCEVGQAGGSELDAGTV